MPLGLQRQHNAVKGMVTLLWALKRGAYLRKQPSALIAEAATYVHRTIRIYTLLSVSMISGVLPMIAAALLPRGESSVRVWGPLLTVQFASLLAGLYAYRMIAPYVTQSRMMRLISRPKDAEEEVDRALQRLMGAKIPEPGRDAAVGDLRRALTEWQEVGETSGGPAGS